MAAALLDDFFDHSICLLVSEFSESLLGKLLINIQQAQNRKNCLSEQQCTVINVRRSMWTWLGQDKAEEPVYYLLGRRGGLRL